MKNLFLLIFMFLCPFGFAQERIIKTSDGVELFVKVKGKGYPLLYIHGGPGAGSHWFESFFGDFLEEQFTVVYLDQRGSGRSASPADGDFSLDRMILDLEEVKEELHFKDWFTMSHSFGGIIQMGYADRFPNSQKGLLLVNSTLDLRESLCKSWIPKAAEFLNEKYFGCDKDTLTPIQRFGYLGEKLREKDLFWKMAYRKKKNEKLVDDTMDEISNPNYDFSNAVMKYEEYFANYKTKIKTMEFPVLLFSGEKDWMIGPDHYKNIDFPILLLWKNKGGHMPFLEEKQDLQKAILQYKTLYIKD